MRKMVPFCWKYRSGPILDRKWGCFEEINAGLIRLSFTVVVSGERGGSLWPDFALISGSRFREVP